MVSTTNQDTAICAYFKQEFLEGADKDKCFNLLNALTPYYEQKKAFGSTLLEFRSAYNENGFEQWVVFPNAEAYEQHCKNYEEFPQYAELIGLYSTQLKEVDSLIQGPEAEIAKSPSLMKICPKHKITYKKNELPCHQPAFGFINERDGHVEGKKGGHMVIEYELAYIAGKQEECDAILNKYDEKMKEANLLPVMLRYTHVEGGYKLNEIHLSPESYDGTATHMMGLGEDFVAEMMALEACCVSKSSRIYTLKADLEASALFADFNPPDITKVYGTPVISQWGKPFIGWVN